MVLSGMSRNIDSRGSTASALLGRRVVIVILRYGSRGPDCRSFCFSHAPVLSW